MEVRPPTKSSKKYLKLPHVVHASTFGIMQYYYKGTQKCKNLPKIQGLGPSQTPCRDIGPNNLNNVPNVTLLGTHSKT